MDQVLDMKEAEMNEIDRLTKALTPQTAQQLEDMDVDAEIEAMEAQQESQPQKWEYIETRAAKIRATPQIELIPHWYGVVEAEDVRAVMRRAVVAANSHDALIEAVKDAIAFIERDDTYSADPEVKEISDRLFAALSAAQEQSQ